LIHNSDHEDLKNVNTMTRQWRIVTGVPWKWCPQ